MTGLPPNLNGTEQTLSRVHNLPSMKKHAISAGCAKSVVIERFHNVPIVKGQRFHANFLVGGKRINYTKQLCVLYVLLALCAIEDKNWAKPK